MHFCHSVFESLLSLCLTGEIIGYCVKRVFVLEYDRCSGGASAASWAEGSPPGASWTHLFNSCTETVTSSYLRCGAMALAKRKCSKSTQAEVNCLFRKSSGAGKYFSFFKMRRSCRCVFKNYLLFIESLNIQILLMWARY